MRNKIKQIMNKEEGFTLVELLAVIVILGIIVAIAIPAIGSVIDRADKQATTAEHALVEDAARLYFTSENVPEGKATVNVATLRKEGYLELRDETDTLSGTVTRSRISGEGEKGYSYEFVLDEDAGNGDD